MKFFQLLFLYLVMIAYLGGGINDVVDEFNDFSIEKKMLENDEDASKEGSLEKKDKPDEATLFDSGLSMNPVSFFVNTLMNRHHLAAVLKRASDINTPPPEFYVI